MRSQTTRVISGLVGSNGVTLSSPSAEFSTIRTGQGKYTITYAPSFRARVTTVSTHTSGDNRTVVDNANPMAPVVSGYAGAIGIAGDLAFAFTAVGVT